MTAIVYGLVTSDEPTLIRYVGSTAAPAKRLHSHRTINLGKPKDLWVAEVQARGASVEMQTLGEFVSFADAQRGERVEIRRRLAAGESLLNQRAAAGGRPPGTKSALAGQAKINHQIGQQRRRERESALGVTYTATPETRAKHSAASRAAWSQVSAEQRSAKMREVRASRPPRIVTDEQRQRIKDRPRVCCVVCRSERQAAQMSKHLRSGKCRPVRGVKIWVSCVACRMTVLAWYFERHLGGQSCTRAQKKLNSRVYKA